MPIPLISRRTVEHITHYERFYPHTAEPGDGGYGFECDQSGKALLDKLHPVARDESLPLCQREAAAGQRPQPTISKWVERAVTPAVGQCECGGHVILEGDPCECPKCKRIYNCWGQRLKPVDQWFDENGLTPDTGETMADIFGPAMVG